MQIDFTPLVRPYFERLARRTDAWSADSDALQLSQLRRLLRMASQTETGRRYGFSELAAMRNPYGEYRSRVPAVIYEDIRKQVMRMVNGERDILWPGRCRNYAQSSGTSGGKSKYVPITEEGLRGNHYRGAKDPVAHYLRQVSGSRLFAGKGFILGGSFASELKTHARGVRVGDLSATLIERINPLANLVRVPDKKTALLPDWEKKLPLLARKAMDENITNISGVPSWFLTVIREVMKMKGADRICDVWPNLEVFFHGGISFKPYREEYRRLTDPDKMHFLETYNASEGFFAVQNDFNDPAMLLTIDSDVFYEFIPVDGAVRGPRPIWELEKGRVYELIVTSSNGLWRYRLGDTVRVESVAPVKITIAGRTKSFINAFGEELMEDNAERAMAAACDGTGASLRNYTAAPVYSENGRRGRHQWLVEWEKAPEDVKAFAAILDGELQKLNSDYQAKRSHTIFLDSPEVISAPAGLFDRWLGEAGNHKLGGQRKVPRLCNDRRVIDRMLAMSRP